MFFKDVSMFAYILQEALIRLYNYQLSTVKNSTSHRDMG